MKNVLYKYRTWVLMFDSMFFIAPIDLINVNTPDTSKFVTLAKVKKTNENEYTYEIYGNKDFLPDFNSGNVFVGTETSADQAMIEVENVLEVDYPVN